MELLYEAKDGVATLTLNRPEKLNAVTDAMRQSSSATSRRSTTTRRSPVVVRLRDPRLSAGSDIYETSGRTPVEKRATVEMEAPHLLRRCIKPAVAMIRGYALGGGLELALACDLRIASETGAVRLPEVTLGWILGAGGRSTSRGSSAAAWRPISSTPGSASTRRRRRRSVSWTSWSRTTPGGRDGAGRGVDRANRLEALVFLKSALRMADRTSPEVGVDYERELIALCYSPRPRGADPRVPRPQPKDSQA